MSSPETTKPDITLKGGNDGERRSYIPIATSTPVPPRTLAHRGHSKTKGNDFHTLPLPKKSKAPKNWKSDETLNDLHRKEKTKAISEINGIHPTVPESDNDAHTRGKQTKTEDAELQCYPLNEKPTYQLKVTSASSGKKSTNSVRKPEVTSQAVVDKVNTTNGLPSIIVEDAEKQEDKTSKSIRSEKYPGDNETTLSTPSSATKLSNASCTLPAASPDDDTSGSLESKTFSPGSNQLSPIDKAVSSSESISSSCVDESSINDGSFNTQSKLPSFTIVTPPNSGKNSDSNDPPSIDKHSTDRNESIPFGKEFSQSSNNTASLDKCTKKESNASSVGKLDSTCTEDDPTFREAKSSFLKDGSCSLESKRSPLEEKPMETKSSCVEGKPLSPSIPVRRRLSYVPQLKQATMTVRRASEVIKTRGAFEELKRGNNSVDSLRVLNIDLRDQVAKLRYQLDNQSGSIRQSQWQKIVELRHVRQEEQQRMNVALNDQFQKLDKEKQRELDNLRDQLNQKFESELQKSNRFKDAEISKLKQELSSKDAMLQRLLGKSRHARIKMDIDDRKIRLMDELKELRQAKRELKFSLENANFAERAFSNNLRRHSESFESEMARVKKEAQAEIRQLIEQLKNKDKLISQLEKDLGRQSWGAAAHFAVLERRRSEGNPLPPGGLDLSPPFRTLPEGSDDPDVFSWTPTSIQTPGDVEDVWTKPLEGNSLGKRDLPNQLKGPKDRNKELTEKCRSFLQQNKELTAQNRAFKESNDRANQDTKKLQELLEHSKLQILQLGRQLSQLKAERNEWEEEAGSVEGLRQELAEDKKMINALRKACSDKDRRIELIQHRKKRRRLIESAEKVKIQNAGLKETPFGYEEDDKLQGDGNQSVCSLSSTVSDDSVWEEVFSKEEMERNYQRLMLEQLELQKSHAILQRQTDSLQDPQRENLTKADLQNDLFLAQCRIEQLEHYINEGMQGQSESQMKERERIQAHNRNLNTKVKNLEKENQRLQKEVSDVQERNEDMEFRLMELEQLGEHSDGKELPCQDTKQPNDQSTPDSSKEPTCGSSHVDSGAVDDQADETRTRQLMMEQLAKELIALLKGKGRDAESALKKLESFIDREKSLESMAHELQMKVISLQQEKNSLQDKMLLVEQSQPGKGGNSASLAAAKERQENLALKAAIESQSLLVSERNSLQNQLEDLKGLNDVLNYKIAVLTQQQSHQEPITEEVLQQCKSSNLQSTASSRCKENSPTNSSSLSRKSSDRKSKSRDAEDPTVSKRRKNIPDHELDDSINLLLMNHKASGSVQSLSQFKESDSSNDQVGTMTDNQKSIKRLEKELSHIKKCNDELMVQLQESITNKLEVESSHQSLQDKITTMEQDLDLLYQENVALGDQLRQRVEEFQFSQDERSPRVSELEEFCEDLQDRLRDAENSERQCREKLKVFEKSVEEAESQEMVMREKCEHLLTGDYEAKKQIQALQRTELELRDIVIEKEIVEQALRDKVDFLQKAEAASVERIEELEGIVEDLRQQLDEKSDGKFQSQKEAHKLTEMKHQMTFLETDNKALSARIAELEENEEILRENWRRVADEDFNRAQGLEQKVKMLEGLNRDLKLKLKDAQECMVISMSESNLSLAAELAESEAKIFEDSSDEDDVNDGYMRGVDEVDSPSKQSDTESEHKVIREKMRKLERQLSEVSEQKNTKIESLQEQLVSLKETEIKLSETISEMEMTERELRAKLALYESSEVTVEKMLKYQSKIEELRTSQESLLDQLEIKENEEMTLQEKMQEMERTLRGTIVTLEGEMKGYKQKELKNAGQIRELEKRESELSGKQAQQAEKENGLYVKISSLMDELKASNTQLENVKRQMEDKEDKVRQAKLLEVKLLEIEMECGKKVSALNAKLRHKEEEFRQKESSFVEEISTLRESHDTKSLLEEEFAQKQMDMQQREIEKENSISNLSSQITQLEKELETERQNMIERENLIQSLNGELKSKVTYFESVLMEKETEHTKERQSFESDIEGKALRLSEVEEELRQSLQLIRELESEKGNISEAAQAVLELKSFCDNCIYEVESKAESKLSMLETKLTNMQSHITHLQSFIFEKIVEIRELETEKEEQRKFFEDDMLIIREEREDLNNKVCLLNSQLEQEVNKREAEKSSVEKDFQEREATLCFDVSNLQHQVEQHKLELIAKLSELEVKNKANCELSLELSNLRHDHKGLQKELDKSKHSHMDTKVTLESIISEKEEQLDQSTTDILQLNRIIEGLKKEVKKKGEVIEEISSEKDILSLEKSQESQQFIEKLSHIENQLSEQCQELERVNKLHSETENELLEIRKTLDAKDHVIQMHEQEKGEKEILLKETQSHVLNAQVHKDSLAQELQSANSRLEEAKNQNDNQKQQIQLLHNQLQLLHNQLQTHHEETKNSKDSNTQKDLYLQEKDQMLTSQQQELQVLKNQLQDHQSEIDQYKTLVKEKEEKLQEKDQMYEQVSTELKRLHQHLQDRDQELKQAESKIADVELKLNKAENRVRELESNHASLEIRLEERYAVSQNAEKVLLSKEMQCQELEKELAVTEKNLANLKDQVSVGDVSHKELSQKLQQSEQDLEHQQADVLMLRERVEQKEAMNLSLESKLNQLEADLSCKERDYNEEKDRSQKLESELIMVKSSLNGKEKQCHDSEIQISSLQAKNEDLSSKCESLSSELNYVRQQIQQKSLDYDEIVIQTKKKDSEVNRCKDELTKNAQELSNHLSKFKETEKLHSEKITELENMIAENCSLKQTIDKLSSEKDSVNVREEQLSREIQSQEEKNKNQISELESEKSNLISVMEFLKQENTDLKQSAANDLIAVNQHCSQIAKEKEDLSKQLSQIQNETQNFQTRIDALQSDLTIISEEKDIVLQQVKSLQEEKIQLETDNIQLQKEIDEADKEFQNLTVSFEESKANIEKKVYEISEGKLRVEEDFEILQKKYASQSSDMVKQLEGKDIKIGDLSKKCKDLEQENVILVSAVDSLKLELSQAQDKANVAEAKSIVEEQMVCETSMNVSMAPPLFLSPSSDELVKDNTEEKMKTKESGQRLIDLETALNEMQGNEKQSQRRICELETIEKELKEQIVDIEMTVIVPLETENQELKDEIGIVKQERDEAIAKISRWDEDDEDQESRILESERVHQRLEEALIFGEELEKKNNILMNDIQKLEIENENLNVKITDLEANERERNEEVESLQEEMKRLQEVDQDTSVLEETETTLMDRVLDLEERERNLLQELEKINNSMANTQKDGSGLDSSSEKMKYLEQKNQILEDAEGRYMDKIMELEEDKHRLLSQLSSLTDNFPTTQISQSHHIPHTSVNSPSVSISTQTLVPFESDYNIVGATNSSDHVDSSHISNPLLPSEQTSSSVQTISALQDQVQDSKVKLEELEVQLREKETVVLYLQDKLELLKDSEGRLMDKLLEAEEKASSDVHSKYSAEINELHKKIEQIQEENEFLAENVEQYKKSFKEEKEKCNDLQDRLLEDSSNLAELHRTQEELVKTQQMVEEIQTEYEEEISKVESSLKEELSQAAKKQSDMEEMVIIKSKRAEELEEQVDILKTLEKELRSKMASMRAEEEDSAMSDSGLSADDPRIRHGGELPIEAPIVHRSVKTVLLSSTAPITNNPPSDAGDPRPKRKHRLQSIENISREELVFLVEDLQDKEAALKKRVSDLQAIDTNDSSSERISHLESGKVEFEKKRRHVERQSSLSPDSNKPSGLVIASDIPNNINIEGGWCGDSDLDRSFTSGVSSSTSTTMLEKPEDVLIQRIKELEGLDKHNKNTVSELERDREVLHEIARKDKATIHDLNVKIRELQLSERSLKEQVTNLEVSENSYFTKCEDLEGVRVQLEDRVHELEIHERRLRELVRRLKLDEERWLSKSDGMENAVAELSANEAQLKRILQDIEMEKGGLSERAEYLEARIRELESVEVALLARVKEYENNETTLQNRLVQLENAESAAHSRASELDMVNVNLAQQHKKMVDENAIMSQHLAQLHGQVQELDRRLLSSRDSEIAYKQHVESLQKNESMLQKKVREYELREIDSQSAIRELEQNAEISNDKLSALQRSENRLRYRVQELEGVGGQIPGELTPSQQQKVPQNIEDCQKRIVVLQSQVENLKLQLRQALDTAKQQSANKSEDADESKRNSISIGTEEYSQLHAKAALVDEYAYQNGELESNQEQLRDTILQLRQGKGACGHEVEIEVYKRRMESLQTFISKLKLSLSQGQTTSLLDPDQESGPDGETLPARHLQVLESERVLQSVRGLHHNGKADTPTDSNGGVQSTGLALVEESMIQAEAAPNMASLPPSTSPEDSNGGTKQPEQPSRLEEPHWKAIEARKPVTNSTANDSRGGVSTGQGGETKPVSSSPRHNGKQSSSPTDIEEVTGFLNLQSESELSSYHRTTQNDTDSCDSPIPPPRKNRGNRLSKNLSDDNSSNNGSGSDRDHHRRNSAFKKAAANQKHFGEESLPLTASNIERQLSSQQQTTPVPLSRFAEDSFYLPSSTQEGIDSLDDDEAPPPLPSQGPPGQQEMAVSSGRTSRVSSTNIPDGRRESLDNSTSGLSIRERIAMIERHLQSDAHTGSQSNREEEDQLFYWKRKSTESLRQAETLDKNNKFLKEDINRLEKELEEKRRYINTLELWLSSTEDLLKNKAKQTDREMVEKLQLDLAKLRRELQQSGYRKDDALLDPAALKTELEHRDRDITAKRNEIESLAQELRRCHKECRSIEGMRRTALDSLRGLEKELLHLQDSDEKLKKSQADLTALKVQYDELDQFKNQALAMVQPLQIKVERLSKKCRDKDVLLRRLGAELRRGHNRPSSALDELTRLERAMNGEEYYTDHSDNMSDDLSPRPTNHRLCERSVSMDELSFHSDTESLHMPAGTGHTQPKRQRPTPYVNSRPRSAEASGSSNPRSPRKMAPSPRINQLGQRAGGHIPGRGFDLAQEHFVAIADYDPGLYSQSGRPRLELSLREGDHVRVSGPMDRLGYCEAECNGRTGLVPANYLQPFHFAGMNGHSPGPGHHQSAPSIIHLEHSLAPPLDFQDQSPRQSSTNGNPSRMPAVKSLPGRGPSVPDPPSNVHVRGIQDGCLMLAWKPPPMDANARNKGFQVMGYMVFVDNQEYEQIPNPQYCQATIEQLDPSTPHLLAVQSLCAGGRVSPRTELVFEGMVRLGDAPPQVEEEDGQQGPLDTDLSSVLNSVHYTKGAKKKVMALYEYNPEHQSPHDYTAFELTFHAGDVIAVYGEPRPDGFYHGEIEGRRGLVPACFVEDLSTSLRIRKIGSEDSGHESSKV